MTQTQSPGVEHRAPETLFAAAVLAVSRDGMTESRQVNADLVGPAGVEVTAHERMVSLPFHDLVAGPCEATARDHRHPLAFPRITADRSLELPRLRLHATPDDREIGTAQRAVRELL